MNQLYVTAHCLANCLIVLTLSILYDNCIKLLTYHLGENYMSLEESLAKLREASAERIPEEIRVKM
ncbi:MAG: hypothetical protein QF605_08470, partial [Rhodospirillales bacterium]|nr:hypothetical protein [Rhodospirillales bacterium]